MLREHHFPCKGFNYDWNVLKCAPDDPSQFFFKALDMEEQNWTWSLNLDIIFL